MSRIDEYVASLSPAEREQFKRQIDSAKRREEELGQVRDRIDVQLTQLRENEQYLRRYATALRQGATRIGLAHWRASGIAPKWAAVLADIRPN